MSEAPRAQRWGISAVDEHLPMDAATSSLLVAGGGPLAAGTLSRYVNWDDCAGCAACSGPKPEMACSDGAVRILGRGPAAEDALQEVFVKVWERGGDFDGAKGSVIGWMATIARNRALDDIRRAKTSGAVAFSEDFEPVAETEHPLDGRERGEALARLMKCLDGLDDEKREIILLAYYRGVTREALAGRFGRPVPTIKTWLHRGLAQLRECLSS